MNTLVESPFNRKLTGLEIKDWVWYHTHNKTIHSTEAKGLNGLFNLNNEKTYMLIRQDGDIKVIEVTE